MTDLLREGLPFFAAVAVSAISPLTTAQAKSAVRGVILGRQGSVDRDLIIPYYLTPQLVECYVEFAGDVMQIAPAIFLAAVGLVLGLPSSAPVVMGALLFVAMASILGLTVWIQSIAPETWTLRKWLWCYSPVAVLAAGANLLGWLVVALLG